MFSTPFGQGHAVQITRQVLHMPEVSDATKALEVAGQNLVLTSIALFSRLVGWCRPNSVAGWSNYQKNMCPCHVYCFSPYGGYEKVTLPGSPQSDNCARLLRRVVLRFLVILPVWVVPQPVMYLDVAVVSYMTMTIICINSAGRMYQLPCPLQVPLSNTGPYPKQRCQQIWGTLYGCIYGYLNIGSPTAPFMRALRA